jgi:hypothetical protein
MNRFYKKVVLTLLLSVVLTGALSCRKAETGRVIQKQLVYKKIGNIELRLDIFEPQKRNVKAALPAVILFHGGGWFMGEPNAMYPHCIYFANRGMVAISAQYRLSKDGNSLPIEAVEDAKSAVRYVRSQAANLGIDPNRIAVGGASAGGHLAVCTALFDKFDAAGEEYWRERDDRDSQTCERGKDCIKLEAICAFLPRNRSGRANPATTFLAADLFVENQWRVHGLSNKVFPFAASVV